MLMTHTGGWEATKADLQAVPVPEPTDSYLPVPYGRLVEEVALHIPRFGLRVTREDYALSRGGNQMFGVLTCQNGTPNALYSLAIGLRSSYDRSLAVELVAGSRVFVCDNLAFHGEAEAVRRKHTVNIFRDLPGLIYDMLTSVQSLRAQMDHEIADWQQLELPPATTDHLIVEAVRRDVLPASWVPKLLQFWDEPEHEDFRPKTAWSLFNAFTGLQRFRQPHQQMAESLRLTKMFREVLV